MILHRIPVLARLAALASLLAIQPATGAGPTTLAIAHRLPADGQEWLVRLAERYNRSQPHVVVRLVAGAEIGASGATLAVLSSGEIAAAEAERAFRPLHEVLAEAGRKPLRLLPEALAAVADGAGRPQALPIALSTPILYVDRAAFGRAGLDSERLPVTWFEVQQAADRLSDAGSRCPLTVSRPAATLIEQTGHWHGEPLLGKDRAPAFNGMLYVKHLAMMASWHTSRYLVFFGNADDAVAAFADGRCAMIIAGSDRYRRFEASGVAVAVGRLPRHEGHRGAPRHTAADGAALWVVRGRSRDEYRAAANFVEFLSTPAAQVSLIVDGGFLPFAAGGLAAFESGGLTTVAPQLATALLQVHGGQVGAQLPRLPKLARILDDELAAVWSQGKPAKAALDDAAARGGAAPALASSALAAR